MNLPFRLIVPALLWLPCLPLGAQVPPHRHRVVEIVGEPILKRVEVPLDRPRCVAVDSRRRLLIADAGSNKLFRVDKAGKVVTLAADLREPSGLCLDKRGNIYVANYAGGETRKGSIVRIAAAGTRTVVARGLTGPKGLAIAPDGTLYVALFGEDRIAIIDGKGNAKTFCADVTTPAALCFDAKGMLYAANATDGTVARIDRTGTAKTICANLKTPTDVAISPEGEVIVANFADTSLTRILPNGKTDRYLDVPAGTIGICFRADGNMVVVNRTLKMAVEVKNRLWAPCPHCKRRIPIRIKPRKKSKPRTDI